MSKITIQEVAEYAGVGIGTVSRVLNQSASVSEDTRQKVMEAINILGYKPDAIARQLARKDRARNIGVITRPFIKDYYSFAERLRGVQLAIEASHKSYELMLFSTISMRDYNQRLKSIIRNGLIDGLLILDLRISEYQFAELEDANVPFVSVGHYYSQKWDCIVSDNTHGGYIATEHLIKLGHHNIGYIGNELIDEDGFLVSGERFKGYQKALEDYGIPFLVERVSLGQHNFQTSHHLTKNLLNLSDRPTAIFSMSDTQALACIATIREFGLRVPEDISVIGYDDLEISEQVGLTTVRQHLQLTGELGMVHLIQKLEHATMKKPPTLPALQVIARNTTRAI